MRLFLWGFIAVVFSISPLSCFAFSVIPSVVDVPFSSDAGVVSQTISVTNTEEVSQKYTAKVQEVLFADDGSIASFTSISDEIGAEVDISDAIIAPGEVQIFTVTFAHPDAVTAQEVFALVFTEEEGDGQQVTDAFAALLFPQGVVTSSIPLFRIDAFTFVRDGSDIRAVAQFTNTGDVLVRPVSILIAQDRFGRELGRYAFAENSGRLPIGTSRVLSDIVPLESLGFWHVGGDVTFTLLSVSDEGGDVQQASIIFFTYPGIGIWIMGGVILVLLIGIFAFLVKKRGILRS